MLEFKLIYGVDGYNVSKSIREKIFMKELSFSYDNDAKDDVSWHIICYDHGTIIAAARMYQKNESTFVIGRVAVEKEYRNQYIGDTLMKTLEDKAVQLKGYIIEVGAFEQAVGFYEKEGYKKTGEEYTEDGKQHFSMTKDLTKPYKRCSSCH